MHFHYNRENYPIFVCHNGNWDICANAAGKCASIPTKEAEAIGCKATHFGDLDYVKVTLGVSIERQAGIRAERAGVKWWNNPHPSGSGAAYEWDKGHTAARRIREAK